MFLRNNSNSLRNTNEQIQTNHSHLNITKESFTRSIPTRARAPGVPIGPVENTPPLGLLFSSSETWVAELLLKDITVRLVAKVPFNALCCDRSSSCCRIQEI